MQLVSSSICSVLCLSPSKHKLQHIHHALQLNCVYSIIALADYTNTTAELKFGPRMRKQCVQIPVINDVVPEIPEQFLVKLAEATPLPGIVLTPDIATILINDDDGKCEWLLEDSENVVLVLRCAPLFCSNFGI